LHMQTVGSAVMDETRYHVKLYFSIFHHILLAVKWLPPLLCAGSKMRLGKTPRSTSAGPYATTRPKPSADDRVTAPPRSYAKRGVSGASALDYAIRLVSLGCKNHEIDNHEGTYDQSSPRDQHVAYRGTTLSTSRFGRSLSYASISRFTIIPP